MSSDECRAAFEGWLSSRGLFIRKPEIADSDAFLIWQSAWAAALRTEEAK